MTSASSTRVLLSMSAPDGTTKFVDQLAEHARSCGTEYLYFNWSTALMGRYDVFHTHWPEFLLRGGGRLATAGKHLLFALLLIKLTVRSTPVVRTLHNQDPHEPSGRIETFLLMRLDAKVVNYIALNPFTEPPRGDAERTIIPHGHYRDRYSIPSAVGQVSGRILYIGLIRDYKGVDVLVDQFLRLHDCGAQLRLVGKPFSDSLIESIRRAEVADSRVTARFGFVEDKIVAEEITASEVVVLPYRKMHNSGIVLLALSLQRPVVVPRTPVNEWIAEEVGPGWVHCFDPPFDLTEVPDFIARHRAMPPQLPVFKNRDWVHVAEAHAAAYRRVRRTVS